MTFIISPDTLECSSVNLHLSLGSVESSTQYHEMAKYNFLKLSKNCSSLKTFAISKPSIILPVSQQIRKS